MKLKDCPFCGGKAIIVSHPGQNWDGKRGKSYNIGGMHGLWYVGCPSEFFVNVVKLCDIQPSASWYADLNKAKKAWNNRLRAVGPQPTPKKGERQCIAQNQE